MLYFKTVSDEKKIAVISVVLDSNFGIEYDLSTSLYRPNNCTVSLCTTYIYMWMYSRCANILKGMNTKCKDFHGQKKLGNINTQLNQIEKINTAESGVPPILLLQKNSLTTDLYTV